LASAPYRSSRIGAIANPHLLNLPRHILTFGTPTTTSAVGVKLRPSPRCAACGDPAAWSTRIALPYRPWWSTAADCFGLCRGHRDNAMRGLYYARDPSRERAFIVESLLGGHDALCVEAVPPYGRAPSQAARWRAQLFSSPTVRCRCGAPAGELGHLIPSLAFRITGTPVALSYYEENLEPMCRTCNIEWSDFFRPEFMRFRRQRERWERLRVALDAARSRGVTVGVPPVAPRRGWPGVPIFDCRTLKRADHIEPIGFVMRSGQPRGLYLVPSDAIRPYRVVDASACRA
jgi:hypothetical protein